MSKGSGTLGHIFMIFLWSCTQLFENRYFAFCTFRVVALSEFCFTSLDCFMGIYMRYKGHSTTRYLRSAKSASLQVILAHVCTTNHTKMYSNWSYIISRHTGNRNLRVKLQILRSFKPMRWNRPIDIGLNRSKSISADFVLVSYLCG